MKTKFVLIPIVAILFIGFSASSQALKPVIKFEENPITHNMHITSNGEYYYTCNGGKPENGKISKYSLRGNFVKDFTIELDMRSIMYNKKDGFFYINCYDKNIYKITDLENGVFQLVFSNLYDDDQACLAMSPNGKLLYYFSVGNLKIFDLKDGTLKQELSGLSYGEGLVGGEAAVAVDNKHIYTWNAEQQVIYVYNKKGKLINDFKIKDGDYGFSLSYANGLIFVSTDGNYDTGEWYGYDLK